MITDFDNQFILNEKINRSFACRTLAHRTLVLDF